MDDVINVSRTSMHCKCEKDYFQNIYRKEKIHIASCWKGAVYDPSYGTGHHVNANPEGAHLKIETFLTFVGIKLYRLSKHFLSFFKIFTYLSKIGSLRKSSVKTFLPQAFSPFLPPPTTLKSGN